MDERKRAKRGVLVCFTDNEDGSLTLSLDDVVHKNNDISKWLLDVFITSKDYDAETLKNLSFSENELAEFGYSIISRLYAFQKQGEL